VNWLTEAIRAHERLHDALIEKDTLLTALQTLLAMEETSALNFVKESMKAQTATCPGICNPDLVKFASNFFVGGVVVDKDGLLALTESKTVRSVNCGGSKSNARCHPCVQLASYLARQKYAQHIEEHLAQYQPSRKKREKPP